MRSKSPHPSQPPSLPLPPHRRTFPWLCSSPLPPPQARQAPLLPTLLSLQPSAKSAPTLPARCSRMPHTPPIRNLPQLPLYPTLLFFVVFIPTWQNVYLLVTVHLSPLKQVPRIQDIFSLEQCLVQSEYLKNKRCCTLLSSQAAWDQTNSPKDDRKPSHLYENASCLFPQLTFSFFP